MTAYVNTGPFNTGTAPGISKDFLNAVEAQLDQAVTADGTNGANFVQVGSGNAASTPLQIIVCHTLPAAGHKGRIAIVVPFTLP